MNASDWESHLRRLLTGTGADITTGAEIEVTEPDGTTRRWPLARHHRLERTADGGWFLWLRPLTGDAAGPAHRPAFPHERARRQALTWTSTHRDGDTLVFGTPAGQTVRIRPVRDDLASRLNDWDTFTRTVLAAAEELDLDRLEDDSWG